MHAGGQPDMAGRDDIAPIVSTWSGGGGYAGWGLQTRGGNKGHSAGEGVRDLWFEQHILKKLNSHQSLRYKLLPTLEMQTMLPMYDLAGKRQVVDLVKL